MYTDIDWWTKIRFDALRGETSKREILRRGGIDWETLKKYRNIPSRLAIGRISPASPLTFTPPFPALIACSRRLSST